MLLLSSGLKNHTNKCHSLDKTARALQQPTIRLVSSFEMTFSYG